MQVNRRRAKLDSMVAGREHNERLQFLRLYSIEFALRITKYSVGSKRWIHPRDECVQFRPFAFKCGWRHDLQKITGVQDQVWLQRLDLLKNRLLVGLNRTSLDVTDV